MSFVKFDSHKLRLVNSLRVNNHGMPISREAWERLGLPERIDVYYDTQAKAIQLKASTDGYKVTDHPAPHISIKLNKVMPIGKYVATKDNIYVLEQP